ncbi:hypothetical protein VTH06DRAFT_3233 [Thermothelomyces fergusii]
MGRWSHLDSDDERLPEGMVRVGYDADTQVYTYRDSDGSYWEGAPGARYGKLHRVRPPAPPLPSAHVSDNEEEQAYVLHDFYGSDTDESAGEGGRAPAVGRGPPAAPPPRCPNRAVLHAADRPPGPHRTTTPARGASKALPRLSTAADRAADPDSDRLSTATTIRASISSAHSIKSVSSISTATTATGSTGSKGASGLRRSGTLSRLARFLSPSSSSSSPSWSSPSPSDPGGRQGLARRSTVHGRVAGTGTGTGTAGPPLPPRASSVASRRAWASATSSCGGDAAAGRARWPGAGTGAGTGYGPGGQRKKCATTFEEILGE